MGGWFIGKRIVEADGVSGSEIGRGIGVPLRVLGTFERVLLQAYIFCQAIIYRRIVYAQGKEI